MVPIRREKSYKAIMIISLVILLSHLSHYNQYIFKEYVVEAFRLPTNSMTPTLVQGDRFLVRKSNKYIPKRGDVVAFKLPEEPNTIYIKRVAALSGETVEIKNNTLYIDGHKIQHPAFQEIEYPSGDYIGMEGKPFKVPQEHIFVIGDNSINSWDSRDYGAVPQNDIIGKSYKIYWPLSRRGHIE
jgi:signal peptidase I